MVDVPEVSRQALAVAQVVRRRGVSFFRFFPFSTMLGILNGTRVHSKRDIQKRSNYCDLHVNPNVDLRTAAGKIPKKEQWWTRNFLLISSSSRSLKYDEEITCSHENHHLIRRNRCRCQVLARLCPMGLFHPRVRRYVDQEEGLCEDLLWQRGEVEGCSLAKIWKPRGGLKKRSHQPQVKYDTVVTDQVKSPLE